MTELRNPQIEIRRFRVRLIVAGLFVVACFGVLLARFVFLQVVQYETYQAAAEENRISVLPVVPNRGLITDRNGVVLARNYSAYTLEITPSKVKDLEATINALSAFVEIQPRDRKRFKKLMDESKNFDSLPIRTRLTDDEVARFAANRWQFKGVDIKARLFRQYPLGELASHVVGYIARISPKDVETLEEKGIGANYKGSEHIGKTGLEKTYEKELHGQTGFERVEVDAGGRAVRTLAREPSSSGNNLILSLDIRLQEIAEKALGDRKGAVVAIDPKTGDVLAFASRPGFDPNLFIDGIDQTNWDLLNNDPDRPLLNRPLRGTYPPGSTFKPFMAMVALTTGKRTPFQSITDPGFFVYGNHRFRDDKVGGHGSVDMVKSISVSCDTYYYQLAVDMGIETIARSLSAWGFGSLTGIDLDGEAEGVLPSPAWKQKRFKKAAQQRWFPGETVSIGIGQGYNSYTPLQIAHATATLANNGVVMRPKLVKYIQNVKTGQRNPTDGAPVRTIPVTQEQLEVIHRGMQLVNLEGTAASVFRGAPYTSAGKTGTSQVIAMKQNEVYNEKRIAERFRDHALYMGFAPKDEPKIAVAVIVENGGFGARSAAPIARQIFDFHLLGKRPDSLPTPIKPAEPGEEIEPEVDREVVADIEKEASR